VWVRVGFDNLRSWWFSQRLIMYGLKAMAALGREDSSSSGTRTGRGGGAGQIHKRKSIKL